MQRLRLKRTLLSRNQKKNKLSEAEVSSEEKKIFKNPFCKFKEVINSLKGYSKDEIDEELTAEIVADCFHWASAYRQYGGEEYESEIWDNWGDPIVKYILAHKEDLF